MYVSYDDSSWESLKGPLGRHASDTINSNFSWEGDNKAFYLRRIFYLTSIPSEEVVLHLLQDDAVEVYINGSFVTEVPGYKTEWLKYPINPNVFIRGKNLLAIKYTTVYRPDYLDYGLYGGTAVEEDYYPKLHISVSKSTLDEGETFELIVKADSAPDTPTTLMLTCDNSVRFDFPTKLELPVGESTVSTTVTVIDDHEIADTQSAVFTVSAENYESGETIVMVYDDDMPHIELELAPTAVSANASSNAIMGTIKRSDNLNSKVIVVLSDDAQGLLTYSPQQVTLERNATEAHFTISPKSAVSTDQEVNITAAVYVKTCDCPDGAQSGGSTTQKLTLLAGEGAALDIKPLATDFSLDSNDNGIVITIESPLQENLTVNVTSNFDDYLDYPHAVEIPAGDTSISIPVKKKDEGVLSVGQVITFTATAAGYATAACWIIVTENSLPDAVISSFEVNATEAEAGSEVELTIVVKNAGSGQLSEETPVKVTLSDKSYPVMLKTGTILSSGESTTITTSYQLPLLTGDFSFQAIVNPAGKIEEAVTTNNLSQEIPISITPNYQVTATVDKSTYGQGEVITVTGKATGTKNAFADVEVYFINDGMRQTVKAKTDSEGNYSVVFLPIDGTSGHFVIGACFPGEEKTDAMAEAYVYGLKLESYRTNCQIGQGTTYSGSITITNPCDMPQTNVRVVQQDSPVGCEVSFTDRVNIAAGETIDIPFVINAGNDVTTSMNRLYLSIKSNEDALVEHTIDYSIEPVRGCLKTDSTTMVMTMTQGVVREFPVVIWNDGMAPTGTISLTLPSWIQSVTPQQLPSLSPGDSVTAVLRVVPNDKMYLNIAKKGRIGMTCTDGTGLAISLQVTPVSDQTGTVTIDVIDEFTYCTEEKPHVSGAKIQVINRSTQAVVAEGVTNAEGKFTANIPEGWYRLKVSADYHEAYDEYLLVDPGTNKTNRVFISFNGITTEWKVEETEIEDEYSMETVLKFETQVPPPYIEVIWPKEKPQLGKYFPVVLENKGLIKFFDVKTDLRVKSGNYGIELMGSPEIDTLAAGQAVVLYARLTSTINPDLARATLQAPEKASTSSSVACVELASDTEAKCECYVILDKEFKYSKNYGNCNPRRPYTSGSGTGGGYGDDDDDDDDDDNTQSKPGNIACDIPKFKIVTVNGSRVVRGVATDGVSQVKIVLDGDYDKEHNNRINWGSWVIDGNTNYGGIEYIDKVYHDPLEGVIYTAPTDFPGHDETVYKVRINLPYILPDKQEPDVITVEVELIRVPIVFVHGLKSSSDCWTSMIKYLEKHGYPGYLLYALNYSAKHNDSFEENKLVLHEGLTHFLTSPVWNQHVIEKIDVLAHSMGGLLTKKYLMIDPSAKNNINKIITINTPFGGSQLGDLMTDDKINFIHEIGSNVSDGPHYKERWFLNQLFTMFSPTKDPKTGKARTLSQGAVGNLSVKEGGPISVINEEVDDVHCHAIVTSARGDASDLIKNNWEDWLYSDQQALQWTYSVLYDQLGYDFHPLLNGALYNNEDVDAFVNDVFDEENDQVVPMRSQMGGLSNDYITRFPAEGRGDENFTHTESCKNSEIQERVLELLKSNYSLFSNKFKKVDALKYNIQEMSWWQILKQFQYNEIADDIVDKENNLTRRDKLYNDYRKYDPNLFDEWREGKLTRMSAPRKTESTNNSYLKMTFNYADSDSLLYISIEPVGNFSKISFGCLYNDMLFGIVDSTEGVVRLPDKIQGDVVIYYEGCDGNGKLWIDTDTITVNTIGQSFVQKISFVQDSLLIINNEYLSPRVLCTWSDGIVTEVENPTLSVTNGNLAYIEDNKYVYGKNSGHTNLVATYGNLTCSTPLEVYITQEDDDVEDDDSNSTSSVCSTVSVGFKNKSVMTRQAFRGTLTINNNHPSLALQKLKLHLEARDEDGKLATQHEFQITPEALNGDFEGELDFDAGWSLKSGGKGVATILFIPTKNAAPTEPKRWSFGGTISYTDPFTGLVVTHTLNPVTLTVNPTPVLDFTYFMQRDAIGDDPMTPEYEESVPAEFALLINNKGNADAKNLRFVCKRPEIVENDQGLQASFSMVSSQLNGVDKALTLSDDNPIEVGTVAAQTQTYLQWWMKSSVLGHFTEYDVTFNHKTSFGNEELSLIDQVSIHELIRGFTPSQLLIHARAFLVNDIEDSNDMPDRVYFTDATQQEVTEATQATVTPLNGTTYILSVTPYKQGWTYAVIDNPVGQNLQVSQITRQSDGKEVPADNIWLTEKILRDGEVARKKRQLHFIGDVPEGGEQFLVTFEYKPSDQLVVESYEGVPDEDVELEEALTEITVHFNKSINEETFTMDDLTLFHEGTAVDMSTVSISRIDDQTYRLNLGTATSQEGYYALMVNTQSITDSEGFEGTISKEATWVQKKVVEGFILGDVNGNGQVDIGDAVSIVNRLVGKGSNTFVEKAADTNKNGQIDLGDVMTIVNYLMGKTASFSRLQNEQEQQ